MNKIEYTELIIGSMYSEKTSELLRRLKRLTIAGKKCQVFKLNIDDRYADEQIVTHDGAKVLEKLKQKVSNINNILKEAILDTSIIKSAISINSSNEILDNLENDTNVVGIDEVQFFDSNIINVIKELNNKGIRVIAVGLDLYSSGESMPIIGELACYSKYVNKCHAVCCDCGDEAWISYKLDGNEDSTIDIGSTGKYIALCENCRDIRLKNKD